MKHALSAIVVLSAIVACAPGPTLQPSGSVTATTAAATATAMATATVAPPSTATVVPTSTPSLTPVPTATWTPRPTATRTNTPVPPLPRLYADGAMIKRRDTQSPVWLKGVSVVSPISQAEPRALADTRTYMQIAKGWGANLIRLQFDNDRVLANEGDLRQIVAFADTLGMYVILSPATVDGPRNYADLPNDKVVSTMRHLAQEYANTGNVLFELWNEPGNVSWEQWLPWAVKIGAAIRQQNPNALLLVSGTTFSRDFRPLQSHPFPLTNVVYSVHDYRMQDQDIRPWWTWMVGRYPIIVSEFGGGVGDDPSAYGCPYQSACDVDYMRGTLAIVNQHPQVVSYNAHEVVCCGWPTSLLGPDLDLLSARGQIVVDDLKKFPPTRFH